MLATALSASQPTLNVADEANISLVVLLTGLVIVFVVLIALVFIIKGYGALVNAALNKDKQTPVAPVPEKAAPAPKAAPAIAAPAAPEVAAVAETGIPGDILAVIAAAVYDTCGAPATAIKSVKRVHAGANRSAWGMAGMMENTRPF